MLCLGIIVVYSIYRLVIDGGDITDGLLNDVLDKNRQSNQLRRYDGSS